MLSVHTLLHTVRVKGKEHLVARVAILGGKRFISENVYSRNVWGSHVSVCHGSNSRRQYVLRCLVAEQILANLACGALNPLFWGKMA